jgi:hypothetical protein
VVSVGGKLLAFHVTSQKNKGLHCTVVKSEILHNSKLLSYLTCSLYYHSIHSKQRLVVVVVVVVVVATAAVVVLVVVVGAAAAVQLKVSGRNGFFTRQEPFLRIIPSGVF